MALVDPGYGYSNAYINQTKAISLNPSDTAILVNSSTPYTASAYGVINSGVMVSGSGTTGTLYLYSGGTVNINALTNGTLYPFSIANATVTDGSIYVIY